MPRYIHTYVYKCKSRKWIHIVAYDNYIQLNNA